MSYTEGMTAWQREWLEVYEFTGSAPYGDIVWMLDPGEFVYAKVKPGAPPAPKRKDYQPSEQGSRARVR